MVKRWYGVLGDDSVLLWENGESRVFAYSTSDGELVKKHDGKKLLFLRKILTKETGLFTGECSLHWGVSDALSLRGNPEYDGATFWRILIYGGIIFLHHKVGKTWCALVIPYVLYDDMAYLDLVTEALNRAKAF